MYPVIEGLSATVIAVSSESVTFIFQNDSDKEYIYGSYFTPEKLLRNGKWAQVKPLENVALIYDTWGKTVEPGARAEITYSWKGYYGTFPAGNYRILVPLLRTDILSNGVDDPNHPVLCIPFLISAT